VLAIAVALVIVPLHPQYPGWRYKDPTQWKLVYEDNFSSTRGIRADRSTAAANGTLRGDDSVNARLQLPTVPSAVRLVHDPSAGGHSAIELQTMWGRYRSGPGWAEGWENGRIEIPRISAVPPFAVSIRARFTRSVETKSAIMWWPAGKRGWPWEVDIAETFGGKSGSPWADRQLMTENWHHALGVGRRAVPFLRHEQGLNALAYHTYTLYVTRQKIWETVDGRIVGVAGPPWLPSGRGFLGAGMALTGRRSGQHTHNGVFIEWAKLYKPDKVARRSRTGRAGT
jgi:hypothetical protein